jgi:phosphatidylinositol alpha 1,6-mannosyltransferase
VVAPAAGGPLDLVDHGRTGLLFDPSDRRSLRRTVSGLVHDASLRTVLSTAALGAVTGRSWASVVDELVEVHYAAVTCSPGLRAAA